MESSDMINPVLPPGFRFHPTDEELIIHYLKKKISSSVNFSTSLIADIDLYKFNPWELPGKAMFGEDEWFFFSPRNRKYPNGARPNRAAASGYWKASGIDKPIIASSGSQCIGVKKALVFYRGHPPKGSKTKWMMYEYRLLNHSSHTPRLRGSMRLDDWVLCRISHKSNTNGKSSSNSLPPFEFQSRRGKDIMENTTYSSHYRVAATEIATQLDSTQPLSQLLGVGAPTLITENDVFDENGCFDFLDEASHCTILDSIPAHQTEMQAFSMMDALDKIRKVLSIGALNEQVPSMPNIQSIFPDF